MDDILWAILAATICVPLGLWMIYGPHCTETFKGEDRD